MFDLNQRIKKLERDLKNMANLFSQTSQKVQELKTQNRQEIGHKEQELEDWRKKLEVLQQERNGIRKEIREKVVKLEKSNLENTEKQSKINKLLTEHSEELEEVDKLLYDERTQYRNIRDKLIIELCKPCPICPEKERSIKHLEQRLSNLQI